MPDHEEPQQNESKNRILNRDLEREEEGEVIMDRNKSGHIVYDHAAEKRYVGEKIPDREEVKLARVEFFAKVITDYGPIIDLGGELGMSSDEEAWAIRVADNINAAVSRLLAEERERCAKIAESLYEKTYWDDPSAGIAAAIRSQHA